MKKTYIICDMCSKQYLVSGYDKKGQLMQLSEGQWSSVNFGLNGAHLDFCSEECLIKYFQKENNGKS